MNPVHYLLTHLRRFASDRGVKGQGVVEYAGAIVVATVLIAGVLTIVPTQLTTLYTTIMDSVQNYFTGQLP